MAKKKSAKKQEKKSTMEKMKCETTGGCFYFLGFLGALIYYLTTATSFWNGVVGVGKALLWPAFLVYELLKFLGM